MRQMTTELKVGIFIILAVLVLAYMTMRVGDYRIRQKDGYRLISTFDNVAGLDVKSAVKMAGVDAGKVEKIELVGGRARVTIRVRPNVVVHTDGQAMVRATGMLGDKYLELTPGTPDAPAAKDGAELKPAEKIVDFERLLAVFTDVGDDLKGVTRTLNEVLGTKEGKEDLRAIVTNLRNLSKNIDTLVLQNKDAVKNTIENLEAVSGTVKDDWPALSKDLRDASSSLRAILDENRGPAKDAVANIKRASEKLDDVLASVDRIAKKVDKGEGTIGKLMTDDKLYTQVTNAADGINRYISRTERFRTFVTFRGEYQHQDQDTKGYFGLALQPRDDKSYIFEVIKDPKGKRTETTTTTTRTDGGTTTTDTMKEVKFEDKLAFTAQFGRRWGPLALRIGLTESEFGLGGDAYLLKDDLRLSVDAWRFSSDEADNKRVHMKAAASYSMFKYLFATVGWDNFLNRKRDNFFVGGGVRFEDEDLKYILGTVPIPKQ